MPEFKKLPPSLTKADNILLHECYVVNDFPLYAMDRTGRLYDRVTTSEVPVRFKNDGTAFYYHIRDLGNRERNITVARLKMKVFNPVEDMDILDIERLSGQPSDDRLEKLAWKASAVYNNRNGRKIRVSNADRRIDMTCSNVEEASRQTKDPVVNILYALKTHTIPLSGYEYQYADTPRTAEDQEDRDLEKFVKQSHETCPVLVKSAGNNNVQTVSIEDMAKVLDINVSELLLYFERSPNHQPIIPKEKIVRKDFPEYIHLKFQDDPTPWINVSDLEEAACETCRCDAIRVIMSDGQIVTCFSRKKVAELVKTSPTTITNLNLQPGVIREFNRYKIWLYYKRQPLEESAQRSSEKSRPEKGSKRRHLTR